MKTALTPDVEATPQRHRWPRPSPASRRRTSWTGIGLLVFLLCAAWAVAMPLMAAPDEPSHVLYAAAVARGQWGGELGPAAVDTSRPGAATSVDLPTDFRAAASLPNCFAFYPDEAASCQQDVAPPEPGVEVSVETFAGQYPPLYYLLVGWPSLFLDAEAAVYGMRLVSGALTAAFVAWGLYRLTRSLGRSWAAWAAAAAVTPMCLFLGASVNPQALEIASGFAFWAACLALARGASPAGRAVYVQAAVTGAVLVNSRSTGPVWALAILVVALVLAPRGRWREVLAHPAARWVGAAALLAGSTAVGWLVTHPMLPGASHELFPQYGNPVRTAAAILGHTYEYLVNMIGNFGWLDTPVPPATEIVWIGALGALLVPAVAARVRPRDRLALVLLLAGIVLAPVALQLLNATTTGLIWQGRYGLPLAVGAPLVAAAVLSGERTEARDLALRGGRLAVLAFGGGHVAAFWWASRRYAEGMDGDVVTLSPAWTSPIGYLTGVAAYAAVVAALTWIAWRAMRPAAPEAAPAPAGEPSQG